VRLVVAAETAGIIGVAEIVRIGSPGDLEIGEYVSLIDRGQSYTCRLDFRALLGRDVRITLLVEGV
jgi:hypothetical protein